MAERKVFGRPVKKIVINLGVAGEIVNDGHLPVEPPLDVEFKAKASFRIVRDRIEDDGSVAESLVLTVRPDTFEILSTKPLELQKQLPGQTAIDDEAGDEVTARRGRKKSEPAPDPAED